MLGVEAAIGRTLTVTDDRAAATPTIVVSHRFWSEQLSGDRSVLGRTLRLSNTTFEMAGVMPRSFSDKSQVWIPNAVLAADRQALAWQGIARLRDGATAATAMTEVQRKAAAEIASDSALFNGQGVTAVPMAELARRNNSQLLWVSLGVIGALFMIALANLTNLFLARAASRGRTVAVRAALGGSTWQIGRGLLAEGLLLGLAGCVVGLLFAVWGKEMILGFLGGSYAMPLGPRIDSSVIGFSIALALGAAAIVGLEPMRHLGSLDLRGLLQRGSALTTLNRGQRRFRNSIVGLQVGLSMVLVGTATVLVIEFNRYAEMDIGLDSGRTVLAIPEYDALDIERDDSWRMATDVADRLALRPDVAGATVWSGTMQAYPPKPEENAVLESRADPEPVGPYFYYRVKPGFFETMGIQILRGRGFTEDDTPGAPLAGVVSESTADLLWPGEDALGKRLKLGQAAPWITIVGISANHAELHSLSRLWGIRVNRGTFIVSGRQVREPPPGWRDWNCIFCDGSTVAVRSIGETDAVTSALRAQLTALEPRLEFRHLGTMLERELDSYGARRLRINRLLLGATAVAGLLLSLLGTFGVVIDGVTRRTRELGIRMALGARGAHLVKAVATEGVLTAIGGVIGAIALIVATRGLLDRVLAAIGVLRPQTGGLDGPVLTTTAAVILVTATVAAVLGAVRAIRLDPTDALQSE